MAFVKNSVEAVTYPEMASFEEAKKYYYEVSDFDHLSFIIEQLVRFEEGPEFLVQELTYEKTPKNISSCMAAQIGQLDPDHAPIEEVMELLKLRNAYVRNLGISILRNYGDAIRYYIVKFLIGDDKDLRIFAVNVLGDVDFAESRDMLLELLMTEEDINVAMTAVDYMAEIGEPEDIGQLEKLKERFSGDSYVLFAIDRAIESIKGE